MIRIGLVGGTGSGKSEAAAVLRGLGARIVEADRIARDLVKPGSPVLDGILDEFGNGVLAEDGTLDRAKLAAIVFGDGRRLSALNAIIQPPLVEALIGEVEALEKEEPGGVVVVDAALLLDWDILDMFDAVVLVKAPVEVRVERLVAGGRTPADALARIESQVPEERLAESCDVVIDNAGSLSELRLAVESLWKSLVADDKEGEA